MKTTKKIFLALLSAALVSCASVPPNIEQSLNHSFKDGIYSYTYERTLESWDFISPEMEYNISIDKRGYGQAVFIKESQFFVPELNFTVQINSDLTLSSPGNPSLSGYAEKDGRMHFRALIEENGVTYLLTQHCLLLWNGTGEEPVFSSYNGKYQLKDSSGNTSVIEVANGIYRGDISAGTINYDGTFYSGYSQTTKMSMGGMESSSSIESEERGVFSPGGGLELKSLTTTSGGYGNSQSQNVFSTVSAVSAQTQTAQSMLWKPAKTGYKIYSPDKNIPEWYSFVIKKDSGYYYACGTKQKGDRQTALQLAKIYALNEISSISSSEISSQVIASNSASLSDEKAEYEKSITQHTSAMSVAQLSYETVNEFYDSAACKAYVRIRVPKSEIEMHE